jgi:hypothetical protein
LLKVKYKNLEFFGVATDRITIAKEKTGNPTKLGSS